ncbi:MAG: hypothetical protein ACK5WQ_09195 [Alphaproteobacteria bacterium]|jgi:hypothetical protein|nr:hypothetical protein [Rickettsiales bacterium]
MTAFDTAIQALFNDRNLSKPAFFLPMLGANRSVRVITRAPDVFQDVGGSVIETPTLVVEVQVSDCPTIVPGDQFMIDGITYKTQARPRRDPERLIWQVDCYAD